MVHLIVCPRRSLCVFCDVAKANMGLLRGGSGQVTEKMIVKRVRMETAFHQDKKKTIVSCIHYAMAVLHPCCEPCQRLPQGAFCYTVVVGPARCSALMWVFTFRNVDFWSFSVRGKSVSLLGTGPLGAHSPHQAKSSMTVVSSQRPYQLLLGSY